jgi:hypothetical protein
MILISTVVKKFSNLAAKISSFCQVSFANIFPRKMFGVLFKENSQGYLSSSSSSFSRLKKF